MPKTQQLQRLVTEIHGSRSGRSPRSVSVIAIRLPHGGSGRTDARNTALSAWLRPTHRRRVQSELSALRAHIAGTEVLDERGSVAADGELRRLLECGVRCARPGYIIPLMSGMPPP
jgi:hypothetical protein